MIYALMQLIGCGNPNGIAPFCRATNFWPEKMFVDPQLKVYKTFGLTRAKTAGEIGGKGPKNKETSNYCAGLCWSCCSFLKSCKKQGDVYQVKIINILARGVVFNRPR